MTAKKSWIWEACATFVAAVLLFAGQPVLAGLVWLAGTALALLLAMLTGKQSNDGMR